MTENLQTYESCTNQQYMYTWVHRSIHLEATPTYVPDILNHSPDCKVMSSASNHPKLVAPLGVGSSWAIHKRHIAGDDWKYLTPFSKHIHLVTWRFSADDGLAGRE